MLPIVITDTR